MPRVWLYYGENDAILRTSLEPVESGVEVELNASKYRQIKAAEKKFWSFQVTLDRIFIAATSKGIKRFR